jgi:uncharacterized protein (UPF0371 family)
MKDMGLKPEDRKVVNFAREASENAKTKNKGNKGIYSGAAIELPDGQIIQGCNSPLMHSASSVVLNAAKKMAGIPAQIDLLPSHILNSLMTFKKEIIQSSPLSLDLEETLIALAISGTTNPGAEAAIHKLRDLAGCEIHLTHMPTPGDAAGLRKLSLNVTSDPDFSSKALFIN